MNPIKNTKEMLAEMAGIPRMAAGKAVVGQFDRAIAAAIAKYKQLNQKAPSPQEVEQLKSYVQNLSNPSSGLRSGMSAQPRASFELATDPNLINPNTARDEFLTKMTTGRTTKGTNLRPMAQDISDPSVVKNIEAQQMSGQLDEAIPGASQVGSTTPSADYFGEVSTNIENSALQGGAFDKLKQGFFEKTGRYPDADETNALIAEFNPARHQYGSQGVGIMSQRPPSAKGMTDFRNAARNEGVEESYLTKRQGNYPQYIQDELSIQRGELPSIKEAKKRVAKDVQPTDFYVDENGNLVKVYPTMKAEGGQITPDDMRYMMMAHGQEPQKFKAGEKVRAAKDYAKNMTGFQKFSAGLAPALVGSELLQGQPGGAVMAGMDTIAGAALPFFKGYVPLQAMLYSSELGPKEGSRDWEIENQSKILAQQKQSKAQAEADKRYTNSLNSVDPMLLENYEKTNYPGLK